MRMTMVFQTPPMNVQIHQKAQKPIYSVAQIQMVTASMTMRMPAWIHPLAPQSMLRVVPWRVTEEVTMTNLEIQRVQLPKTLI